VGTSRLTGNAIHTILNRAPLTGETNRKVIGDKFPNKYLPELIASNGENRVRGILESHFISPAAFDVLLRNPFTAEDFEAFISERQRTFQDAIESLLVKERLVRRLRTWRGAVGLRRNSIFVARSCRAHA
jgi:hypothetical protein